MRQTQSGEGLGTLLAIDGLPLLAITLSKTLLGSSDPSPIGTKQGRLICRAPGGALGRVHTPRGGE